MDVLEIKIAQIVIEDAIGLICQAVKPGLPGLGINTAPVISSYRAAGKSRAQALRCHPNIRRESGQKPQRNANDISLVTEHALNTPGDLGRTHRLQSAQIPAKTLHILVSPWSEGDKCTDLRREVHQAIRSLR